MYSHQVCSKCKIDKPSNEYSADRRNKSGLQANCKECLREYRKIRRLNGDQEKVYARNRYYANLNYIADRKVSTGCARCGYDSFHASIDFHHIGNKKKNYNVSQCGGNSRKSIDAEIDKCVALCSNCHREFHYLESRFGMDIKTFLKTKLGDCNSPMGITR